MRFFFIIAVGGQASVFAIRFVICEIVQNSTGLVNQIYEMEYRLSTSSACTLLLCGRIICNGVVVANSANKSNYCWIV